MYLIQTVSSRPRVWSSHSNIYTKDDVGCMMSSVDNIPGYRDASSYYCSPNLLRKTAATTYDFPEHPPKKDKKWSLGSLFRRKKKEESDSSSDEECDKKGFLRRRKRDKRKKSNKQRGTFDHIVNPSVRGNSTCNGHSLYDDNGILSDPTGGFASYGGRNYSTKVTALNPNVNNVSAKNTGNTTDTARVNLGSADSLNKKHRKSRAKVRAEARREQNKRETSSDEDSQRSASSSRFRSDENLGKSRDSSLSRKSRAARTERYIRRLSRDEEAALNRENKLHPYKSESERSLRPDSSDVKESKTDFNASPSASPISGNNSKLNVTTASNTQTIVSGLFTIPPSHNNQTRNKPDNIYNSSVYNKLSTPNSNPTNKYSSLTNEHKEKEISYQRSVSYDADIHKSASPELQTVLHVQFPLTKPTNRLRNMSLVEQPRIYRSDKQPPLPPPRDPWRLVSVPNSDTTRPVSYCFERAIHQNNHFNSTANDKTILKPHSFNWHPNYRSTSEDHLASESQNITVQPRPSSAASDHFIQRFIKRQPHTTNTSDDFRYLTEKNPRSRKPIVIQSHGSNHSQIQQHQSEPQKALNFWKQKDQDEINRMHVKQNVINPPSPQMFTAQTRVRTKIFLPSVLKSDMESFVEKDDHKRSSSPFKPISPEVNSIPAQNLPASADEVKPTLDRNVSNEPPVSNRKSSNLEEALDELEAIYNSLRLGDEDLLDRAEQRELSIAAQKLQKSKDEPYPGWGIPRGAISDSSFNYEPFESIDSPKRKRLLKRSRLVDRKSDDMAYRKLNKERKESNDPKEAMSKISYLLTSPVHGSAPDEVDAEIFKSQSKEPDITFDDMVYRNVKYANSSLRVCDPQPPFGIPTGPILPSANSDYLHAVSDNVEQYSFKNKKIPDLVKDDLAFRNLRKDAHKDPILPPLMPEDFANNNSSNNINTPEFVKPDFNSLKKKRAVRSLSANLYSLIQNQTFKLKVNDEKSPEKLENDESDKSSLADIADAMDIARQILKEKENKISETRRAFLSDTEAKYRKHLASNENMNERRLNFLNGMKNKNGESEIYQQKIQVNVPKAQDSFLQSKPPSGIILDKKTPVKDVLVSGDLLENVTATVEDSATESISACNKSLEELLNAFAVEADETSKQISRELESSYDHFTGTSSDGNIIKKTTQNSNQETTELLRDKEFEAAANSELLATTKTESMPTEEVGHITPTPIIHESLANIIITRNADQSPLTPNPIASEIHSESEHDYVNMGSDIEKDIPMIDESCEETKCMSPFEERKSELIAGFQELIKVTDPVALEKKLTPVRNNGIDGALEDGKAGEGEMCDLNPDALTPMKQECAFLSKACVNVSEKGTITSYITDCDIQCGNNCFLPNIIISSDDFNSHTTKLKPVMSNFSLISEARENHSISRLRVVRHNSLNESRRSSGFHSISSCNSASDVEHNLYFSSDDDTRVENFGLVNLKSLESPKLVLKSAIQLSCENIALHTSTQTVTETGLSSNQEVHHQVLQNGVDNDIPSFRAICETDESHDRFKVNSNTSQKLYHPKYDDAREEEARNDKASSSSNRDSRHTLDTNQPTRSWYSDPIVLAFACSYGFACTYQLVSLDAVTVLGLLFVIVSFVAALIL